MISEKQQDPFGRAGLLLGSETMTAIAGIKVIIFGVGGVGSWCAEALIRTGVSHLTIVDPDKVCVTNCNRQSMATARTIGEVKVEALRRRLLEINPQADITARCEAYGEASAPLFGLSEYDYVIDAIDSLKDKVRLILHATGIPSVTLFSSMGAALRTDPCRVRQAEFRQVKGDPLARALRNRFKRDGTFPCRKFRCVYSEEPLLKNRGDDTPEDGVGKARINGSLCQVTAVFGLTLAAMVTDHVSRHLPPTDSR